MVNSVGMQDFVVLVEMIKHRHYLVADLYNNKTVAIELECLEFLVNYKLNSLMLEKKPKITSKDIL